MNIKTSNAIKKLPGVRRVLKMRDRLQSAACAFEKNMLSVPPGHYYSPIPSLREVKLNEERIFGKLNRTIPGIDLREDEQLSLLTALQPYYDEMPFTDDKADNMRYFFNNPAYSYSDAIFLHCMIRHLNPEKIIEVGSGYSSCVILDTNEQFLNNKADITCIEPYPATLLSLIKQEDKTRINLINSNLQDVDITTFTALQENDILFIDSSHIAKVDSDVNYIFFEILPKLRNGVYIHFHDIFYPFEYPRSWVYENRAFNELYMLRAFLEYNTAFRIIAFNSFLEQFHADYFTHNMPLCMKNTGGSIWLQKRIDI
jgi:predicted O-methyltransferase YrrM